jgi:hypothetical protein
MLPADLAEAIRVHAEVTPGLTVTGFLEDAAGRVLARLERAHGGPFPARTGRLRTGRPLRGKNLGAGAVERTVLTMYLDEATQDRLRDALFWSNARLFTEIERETRRQLAKKGGAK